MESEKAKAKAGKLYDANNEGAGEHYPPTVR